MDADVVVVGAGIVGSATAYYLARRGVRVVVIERGRVAGEQSRKNWGFVRQQGRDPLEVPLMMEATLESLRQIRFFLPNFWKNKSMFRFHVGRPLAQSVAAALPGSRGRRQPLGWDRGIEPRANPAKVARSLAELHRVLPSLPSLGVAESWAGYIDATPDLVPVLGEVPSPRGFLFATGFSGHGFAMGPIAGRLVSELIVDGKASLDITGFRYARFAEGAIGTPRNVL